MNRLLALILIPLTLAACAAPRVRTTTLVPAASHEAARLKSLAVLTFDGRDGATFAAEVEAALAGATVDGRPFFTLSERGRLDRVIAEQDLREGELLDPETAAEVGRLMGVQGLVAATVNRTATDSSYREKRSICVEREAPPANSRGAEGKCLRTEQRSFPCTRRELLVTFTPKLIEVASGRIVYSRNLQNKEVDKVCSDSGRPLASAADLAVRARQNVTASFLNDITPHYVTLEFPLMKDDDGMGTMARERFESGLEFARKNRLDRSCELWREAAPQAPQAPALQYNLGVCAEVSGELVKAQSFYKQADSLVSEPNDDISRALARIRNALANRQALDEQLE
ncbi:MAG TPA: hypothetical protein VIU41_09125 [Geobacteraceae bacterium]